MASDLLVTGSNGFVGRHVVARAELRGLTVSSADGDLRDGDVVRRAVAASQPAAVVHLASVMRGPVSGWHALADEVRMAANLIESVRELVPAAAVLVPGSAAEYGYGSERPLREEDPLRPLTTYGLVKYLLELAVNSSDLAGEVRTIFTRSFNHVGPGQRPDAPVAAWARQVAEVEA